MIFAPDNLQFVRAVAFLKGLIILGIINENTDNINPFVDSNFVVPVTEIVEKNKFHIVEGIRAISSYKIEYQKYTKVYNFSGSKELKYALSDKAFRLYVYIQDHLEAGEDFVIINPDYYCRKNKIKSVGTLYKAITELKDKFIIRRKDIQNAYWINPAIFFCGSRLAKYPDKLKITRTISK